MNELILYERIDLSYSSGAVLSYEHYLSAASLLCTHFTLLIPHLSLVSPKAPIQYQDLGYRTDTFRTEIKLPYQLIINLDLILTRHIILE